MNSLKKVMLFAVVTILSRSQLSYTQEIATCAKKQQPNKHFSLPAHNKPITLIVHGTGLPAPFLLIPGLKQQVVTPPGLYKAKELGNFYFYARLAHQLSEADSRQFPEENIYLFGWSGRLSFSDRQEAGRELYKALTTLYTKTNRPITVISISHGGNVVLNAAKQAEISHDMRALVDTLVLVACPIQQATQHYSTSPLFKDIVHLFSPGDIIQVIDPQGIYRETCMPKRKSSNFFSERIFTDPPPNMIQVSLTNYNYSLSHLDFIISPFIKRLPAILNTLKNQDLRQKLPADKHGIYALDFKLLNHLFPTL